MCRGNLRGHNKKGSVQSVEATSMDITRKGVCNVQRQLKLVNGFIQKGVCNV